MQTSPLQASTAGSAIPLIGPSGSLERKFRAFQLLFWPTYGIVLMLPWLGTYTIESMVPNKIGVALTGIVVSSALRPVLDKRHARPPRRSGSLAVLSTATWVLAAAMIWDLSLRILLHRSVDFDLGRLGATVGGIPQLAGTLYHVLILCLWVLGWLAIRGGHRVGALDVAEPHTIVAAAEPSSVSDRIVMQDGKSSIVLGAHEIDWIRADGDYIRVHAGARNLLIRGTLSGTIGLLPDGDYLRIHRSFVVRVGQVREVHALPNNELEVVLRDGTKLKASRTYSDRLRSALGI